MPGLVQQEKVAVSPVFLKMRLDVCLLDKNTYVTFFLRPYYLVSLISLPGDESNRLCENMA